MQGASMWKIYMTQPEFSKWDVGACMGKDSKWKIDQWLNITEPVTDVVSDFLSQLTYKKTNNWQGSVY